MTAATAVDAATHPSYLPEGYLAVALNRQLRGGINRQRPPFTEITIVLADGQDSAIMDEWKYGNFQGAYAYQSINSNTSDGLIVAAMGNIYFINIINSTGYLSKIIGGNSAEFMHTWFVQAEDWVYIQNGYQDPIAWNGDTSGSPTDFQAQGLGSPSTVGTQIATTHRARTSGIATLTLLSAPGFVSGDQIIVSGVTGDGYNGIQTVLTVPTPTTLTYASAGANEGSTVDTGGSVRAYIGAIQLNWTSRTPNATGYEIQYAFNNFPFTTLAIVNPGVTSFIFSPAPANTIYSFRVRAILGVNSFSGWSNIASVSSNGSSNIVNSIPSLSRLNPVKNEMPIGTIMEYANGRVFVSDKNNNIYASDIIFGDNLTDTSNTRNFTETQYWASGGSFTPPARLGQITGMKVVPTINLNDRGQGELVVFCQNGAFTLNASIPRDQWQTAQIQKVSLFGRGCVSPWSVTGVNNQLFFRSDDGWSLYDNAQLDFTQHLSFKKFSREVNRWVEEDTQWLRQFESAMFFDNRLIAMVSPYTVAPRAENASQGLHRPSRAMIVADLDQPASDAPDAQFVYRWNGLWSGPQPTQLLTAQIRGVQRAFCFSFDTDGKNHLFELQVAGTDDIANETPSKVKSFFVTRRFNMPSSGTSDFIKKRINGGDMWLSEINESGTAEVLYRADSYICFNPLLPQTDIGCDFCSWNNADCTPTFSQDRFKRIKFPTPDSTECQTGSDIKAVQGAEFQLQVNLMGMSTVDRVRLSANVETNSEAPSGDSCDAPQDCTPIECCIDSPLDFYKIIS